MHWSPDDEAHPKPANIFWQGTMNNDIPNKLLYDHPREQFGITMKIWAS